MFCVLQTDEYVQSVKRLGLSEAESACNRAEVLGKIRKLGDLMPGTGGARKWRFPVG